MNHKQKSKSNFLRWTFFSISVLFIFVFSADTIYAHVLKIHGSIGAVIHVSPEDDPIAGMSTDFYFELKDKNGKLKPDNCDCTGVVLQNGREIFSAPVFQNGTNSSLESASFSFVFPEKDIYKVRVVGNPLTDGAFEPFTLEWDIRVDRETEKSTQNSNGSKEINPETGNKYSLVQTIGLIVLAIVVAYLVRKRNRNNTTD